nr:immunoglobulin light chain junction region [Macaca mulatta]MOX77239.1 immunoglobulin light chain junction region [Macaca mulatta]
DYFCQVWDTTTYHNYIF